MHSKASAGNEVLTQALIFLPLTVANVTLAVAAIFARMTTQQRWRRWLNGHVLDRWIAGGRYYQLGFVSGDHANPESRVADDLRVAVDAPVDFAIGLLNAVSVRGHVHRRPVVHRRCAARSRARASRFPGFLVVAAVIYAVVASGAMT